MDTTSKILTQDEIVGLATQLIQQAENLVVTDRAAVKALDAHNAAVAAAKPPGAPVNTGPFQQALGAAQTRLAMLTLHITGNMPKEKPDAAAEPLKGGTPNTPAPLAAG